MGQNSSANRSVTRRSPEGGVKVYDKISPSMINSYERSDIIHIMRMNRFVLTDSDTASLTFTGSFKAKEFTVAILAADTEPQVIVKQNKSVIVNQTVKSVDDLKIFLEEKLYQHLGQVN